MDVFFIVFVVVAIILCFRSRPKDDRKRNQRSDTPVDDGGFMSDASGGSDGGGCGD